MSALAYCDKLGPETWAMLAPMADLLALIWRAAIERSDRANY
jgi:hypothetical protein